MAKKRGHTTFTDAQRHYAEKVPVMPANFNSGMSTFFGQNVAGSLPARHYAEKIKPGVEIVWGNNLKKAYGIG